MAERKSYTDQEAHLHFAVQYHGKTRDFFYKSALSLEDKDRLTRLYALKGDHEEARNYIQQADETRMKIKDSGDRKYFFSEFNGSNWNGMR